MATSPSNFEFVYFHSQLCTFLGNFWKTYCKIGKLFVSCMQFEISEMTQKERKLNKYFWSRTWKWNYCGYAIFEVNIFQESALFVCAMCPKSAIVCSPQLNKHNFAEKGNFWLDVLSGNLTNLQVSKSCSMLNNSPIHINIYTIEKNSDFLQHEEGGVSISTPCNVEKHFGHMQTSYGGT